MPVFLIELHHIIHALTGGLDCLLLAILIFPYLLYRVLIKKDLNLRHFLKEGFSCHCKKHKHDHKKDEKKQKKSTK